MSNIGIIFSNDEFCNYELRLLHRRENEINLINENTCINNIELSNDDNFIFHEYKNSLKKYYKKKYKRKNRMIKRSRKINRKG